MCIRDSLLSGIQTDRVSRRDIEDLSLIHILFSWIVIFGFLALIVNSIGILVVYKNKELAERADTYFMCFAAGLLITVPLVLVFPEAVEKNSSAGSAALVGFLFMFLSNRIIQHKTLSLIHI